MHQNLLSYRSVLLSLGVFFASTLNASPETPHTHPDPAAPDTGNGVSFTFGYSAEVIANLSGGVETDQTFVGLFEAGVEFDLNKLIGMKGSSFFADVLVLHNGSPDSTSYIGDDWGVSNIEIEGDDGFRLHHFFFEQSLFDNALALHIGRIAADDEFFVSDVSALFLSPTFAWAPAGMQNFAPAYPRTNTGIFMNYEFSEGTYVKFGVYNNQDLPDGKSAKRGLRWEWFTSDDNVAYLEGGYNYGKENGLGSVKVGLWRNASSISSVNTTTNVTTTDSQSWNGIYLVVDHQLYAEKDGAQIDGFFRWGHITDDDTVPFTTYIDVGVTAKNIIPSRADDTIGLAYAYSKASDIFTANTDTTGQKLLELTYQAPINENISVQLSLQRVFMPREFGIKFPDATVGILRTSFSF